MTKKLPEKTIRWVLTGEEKIAVGHKARILGRRALGVVTVKGYTGINNHVKVKDDNGKMHTIPDVLLTTKGLR